MCVQDKVCKYLDKTTNTPSGEALCCATTCTDLANSDGTVSKVCCPEERWDKDNNKCCEVGFIYDIAKQTCIPPQLTCPAPKIPCPVSGGASVCCDPGTCTVDGTGCCNPISPGAWELVVVAAAVTTTHFAGSGSKRAGSRRAIYGMHDGHVHDADCCCASMNVLPVITYK
jgi:hypothetical protein